MNVPLPSPSERLQTRREACLLCGGGLRRVATGLFDARFGAPGRYDIAVCGCGLEQTVPAPGPAEIKSLYETHYNFGGAEGGRYAFLRERLLFSPLYRLWLALDGDVSFHSRRGTGRLLDVGCNEGRGLILYARNGFRVEGLELNETAAQRARARGFPVHTQPLEGFEASEPFDVAVLSNVLEHSLDPVEMLRQVGRLLKPGGEAWISCPNSRSWQRSAFGGAWINWHVPFHIVHFSEASLRRTIESAGFELIETGQASPALWTAQSVISALGARPGHPTRLFRSAALVACLTLLARLFLGPWSWMVHRFGRGDCLLMRAAKR